LNTYSPLLKRLVSILVFFFFSNLLVGQSCPTVKRNNGNNACHTAYALSVKNTQFEQIPSGNKEGELTVDFGSIPSSQIPVVEGVYQNGSRLNVDFGPPSDPNDDNQGEVHYCFYGANLPPINEKTAIEILFLNPSDSTTWKRCVYSSLGTSGNDPIDLTTTIRNDAICSGESISWSVSATSTSNGASLNYQWYKDGNAISGKTSNTLTITSFSSSDIGTYYCEVEQKQGNVDWTFETNTGTLSLSDCSNLDLTVIQSPELITNTSGDLSVRYEVSFNQNVSTPSTSDFEAKLEGSFFANDIICDFNIR